MKKHLVLATGLALLSTSAFATKARMDAFRQDANRGSLFLEDTRNVFRNAANVNSMKNYVLTEWGVDGANDSATAPQAEGGVFREAGNFNYGLYLGSDINNGNSNRTGSDAAFVSNDNNLSLFVGGDMGMEWGLRLNYANNKNEGSIKKDQSAYGLGLGINMGDLAAWANLDLKDESKGASAAGDKWTADLGLNLGASYKVSGMTVFADYSKTGDEYAAVGAAFKPTHSATDIQVGAAKVYDHGASARTFASVVYTNNKTETKSAATTTSETSSVTLPVTLGFEADATSWLTLRGSVAQPIFLNSLETKSTGSVTTKVSNTNQANVAAGATLNFGKLKVDGSIGTTTAAAGRAAGGSAGLLTLDNLMSRVSVHYWF